MKLTEDIARRLFPGWKVHWVDHDQREQRFRVSMSLDERTLVAKRDRIEELVEGLSEHARALYRKKPPARRLRPRRFSAGALR